MLDQLLNVNLNTAAIAVALAFISSFLRGFQNKNIYAGYKRWTFFTGYLIGILDAVAISVIATSGIVLAAFYGLGMGSGYVMSLIVHKFLSKDIERQRKKRKHTKQEEKIERILRDMLIEHELIRK